MEILGKNSGLSTRRGNHAYTGKHILQCESREGRKRIKFTTHNKTYRKLVKIRENASAS